TESCGVRNAFPERIKSGLGPFGAARCIPGDQHGAIHRSGGRSRNSIDAQPRLLQETVQHTPSKRAVRSAPLERKIDEHFATVGFHFFLGSHSTSQSK